MSINFNNPALSNTYSAMLTDIRDMQSALAKMDFTGATGTPTGSISWSTANNRFERWSGSAWAAAMPGASTTVVGPVQLNDTVISTSTTLAATANAVKTAYDAAVLAASTSAAGRVELATDAETQAGTDTARAVTPASLSARTATETRTGVVELATNAETITGTDTARAVTPAGMLAGLQSYTASTVRAGVVELATTGEATTGTDTARAVTPAGLAAGLALRASQPSGHVRAGYTQIFNGATGYPLGADYITLTSSAEDTWVTVGPTGSGADVIWDALDVLPASARILIVNAWLSFTSGSTARQALTVFAADGIVTPNTGDVAVLAQLVSDSLPSSETAESWTMQFVPLYSSTGVFQFKWNGDPATVAARLYYKGFITD